MGFNVPSLRVLVIALVVYLSCFLSLSATPHVEPSVERLIPQVISKIPHTLPAFTQGLAIQENRLYESTGLYGQSSIRLLDIQTGQILQKIILHPRIFAEGIAIVRNKLIQLTWKSGQAFVYSLPALQEGLLFYEGEGWGLCADADGEAVWMSNGTSILTKRSAGDFCPLQTISVTLEGKPLDLLNDLACVGNNLYANVWQENWLVKIDKSTGKVTAMIDVSALLSPKEQALLQPGHVPNGIAYRSETGTFYLTGKEWPWIFEVYFVKKTGGTLPVISADSDNLSNL